MSGIATKDDADTAELVVRVAVHRDKAAFRTLFEAFAPRLKTYLLRQGAAPERADELVQEAMLAVWRKAAYFDPGRASVGAWLFTIARNLRIDALRRERSATAYALLAEPGTDAADPESLSQGAERERRLRQAVSELSPDQLQVVQKSFFEDKPHAEIASELSLPLGTVKSRLRLALAKLRRTVGDLS